MIGKITHPFFLNARTAKDASLITRAAKKNGVSLSRFLLAAALKEARKVMRGK